MNRLGHSPLTGLNGWRIALPVVALMPFVFLAIQAEPQLFMIINQACSTLPDVLWVALSLLGNGWVIATLLLPLVPRYPHLFFAALMTAPWTSVVAKGTKFIFSTPRPPGVLEAGSFNLIGEAHLKSSMPSGHTLTAFAVVVALTRMPGSPLAQHAGKLYVLAALVGLSRIGMGVHWPADIVAGAAVGWLSGLLAAYCAYRWFPVRALAMPESGFPGINGNGARAAFTWALIAALPALALFTLDEDRGLAPELRYALASMALGYTLWFLVQAWTRRSRI